MAVKARTGARDLGVVVMQTAAAVVFIVFALLSLLGRDYEAAVLSAGSGVFLSVRSSRDR